MKIKTSILKKQTPNWMKQWLPSAIFAFAALLFFGFYYRYHLNYQEQYQLFLFDIDYFKSFALRPGGISDYIGNFITQFYFYPLYGALILGLLLLLLQVTVFYTSKKLVGSINLIALTFLPSILYWGVLCDENFMAGGLVSLVIVNLFVMLYLRLSESTIATIATLVILPVLYWLSGGMFFVFVIFYLIHLFLIRQRFTPPVHLFISVAALLISVALPFVAKHIIFQFPLVRFWLGVTFYRFPEILPYQIFVIGVVTAMIPFLIALLSKVAGKFIGLVTYVLVAVFSVFLIYSSADWRKEEIMAYDYFVRTRNWNRVIALAEKKSPASPLSVTCLNLALAKNGQLGNKMFHYYQNGTDGLFPQFIRDYTYPMVTGEVCYHLGFINTAQRYAFEAMESLPDYQKSVRAVMRLAETAIINGEYNLAHKYLRLLKQTWFYRDWAERTLLLLGNEEQINRHPEWGRLRKFQTKEDFFFSETEKDMMLGVLFRQNHENRLAFEYLMAYYLLNKDFDNFTRFFPLIKDAGLQSVPLSYQEALLYIWGLHNNDPVNTVPYPVSDMVKNRVLQYNRIYTTAQEPQMQLKRDFADTYWYYIHFRNK